MPPEFELTDEFRRVLNLLKSGSSVFLTGKAGTGKSTLIRTFMAATARRTVVAAPTGIAALNVGGYTIHRLFSYTPGTTLDDVRSGRHKPGRFATTLSDLETLIIDEASMVRADLFDKIALTLQRHGPHPGLPFGGVQVVLVGDVLQLPPVVEPGAEDFFASTYETPYFFSAHCWEPELVPTVELTKVFRQAGDHQLTEILNAVREGRLLESARKELNTRHDPDFEPPEEELWLTLAPTNRIVTARNRQRLERLAGDTITSQAATSGDLSTFDPPADTVLHFKIGAQIMMLSNDPLDRWVNGTLSRVLGVIDDEGQLGVRVAFSDGTVATVFHHTWEATRPVIADGTLRRDLIGTFTQFPFKLAWAITIHKSQGQTLDRLIVDLTGGVFDFGQAYVALSRCRSLEGLVLTRPLLAKDLKTDRRIVRFLYESRLRSAPERTCAMSILTVGEEGRLSRPRPVEIAITFDDGTEISTLINPQRDMADARDEFQISADDVLLAPTMDEAWAVLGPMLEGFTLVGVDADETLGLIDHELKRCGSVVPLPLAGQIGAAELRAEDREALRSGRALDRARAQWRIVQRLASRERSASAFEPYPPLGIEPGWLLSRDVDLNDPVRDDRPVLSELLAVSRAISHVVFQRLSPVHARDTLGEHRDALSSPLVADAVAARVSAIIERSASLSPTLLESLDSVGELLGMAKPFSWADLLTAGPSAADVFVDGARVCFTGVIRDASGGFVSDDALKDHLASRGLVWSENLTKTKTDVLVVAELGTQSNKAKNAKKFGKPIISAVEFLRFLHS